MVSSYHNTLFVTTPSAYLAKDHENILVRVDARNPHVRPSSPSGGGGLLRAGLSQPRADGGVHGTRHRHLVPECERQVSGSRRGASIGKRAPPPAPVPSRGRSAGLRRPGALLCKWKSVQLCARFWSVPPVNRVTIPARPHYSRVRHEWPIGSRASNGMGWRPILCADTKVRRPPVTSASSTP